MYKVSVIIPIFNGEKFLSQCLESICNQSLNNIQIICINDGSTDNTLSILNDFAFKDERIKVISTENKGQGSARNTALKEAKGEYISFVDADDWIREDALELLYNKAKFYDLDMLFFQMVNYIDTSKKYVETDLYNHACFEKNSIKDTAIFNYEETKDFLFEIPVCPVSKLYKREFLESNHLQFPEGMYFEDNAFFYNSYFKCTKASFLKEQLYFRRRHDDSVTQRFDKKKFDIIKATNKVIEVFIDNGQYATNKNRVVNHTFSMILEWFKKSPLELKNEFFRLIKKDFIGVNELKNDFKKNLKQEYLNIFNIFNKNECYLDYLTEYKLSIANYDIYDNGRYYSFNSESYNIYKNNLLNDYKISVIIPIYNNETIIHRTLMSIENQTFGIDNIEVLMVNDGSKDGTEEVLNSYADKYEGFKAIHIKESSGSPGTPRNIGLSEATSDYVIFLDHDDFFEVEALEKLYNFITQDNCDFVYGTYTSVDHGLPTKIIYPNEFHGYFENITENPRAIAFPPPSIWTKLFKREFLIENNILFPTTLGEDAIFVSKALFKAKGINYLWEDIICFHVLSKQSSTKNVSYNYLVEGFLSEDYMYDLYNEYDYNDLSFESKTVNDSNNPVFHSNSEIMKKSELNNNDFIEELNENNNLNFYKIRAEGILDFYLNQFYISNLNQKQIISIFPLLYKFVERINKFGIKPHVYKHNVILFDYILNRDIDSILKFKLEPENNFQGTEENSLKIKIKSFIKKASIKTKTYPYLRKLNQKF